MEYTEQLLASDEVFQGKILRVTVDTVCLPNGEKATREVVHHMGAVCVLAQTADCRVVLVRQYRHACGVHLLEVPAGKLDVAGESPESCALRELAEETPYTTDSVRLLYTFYTCAGFCSEKMFLFQAGALLENSQLSTDEDEFLDVVLLDRNEVQAALSEGKIQDAKTLVALQYWLNSH